ncbi:MAG: hypothetical protein SGCHY_003259, partial [Lobulomycetales sp.]
MQQDPLLGVRNYYYAGAYEKTLAGLKDAPQSLFETRLLLLRCYLAQRSYAQISTATRGESVPELLALSILARAFSSGADDSGAADEMRDLVASTDPSAGLGNGSGVPLLAGMLYYFLGLFDDACKVLVLRQKDLECTAMLVQVYLKMDRPDLAEKEVSAMRGWADDATLAQLVEAWVNTYSKESSRKFQDAFYIFEELASSKAATPALLSGQAVCRMQGIPVCG